MPDILKMIMDPDTATGEKKDRKLGLGEWNRDIAERTAAAEGIVLTEAHWKVIEFLRAHYLEHGFAGSGRELANVLNAAFAGRGGSKYLFQLFPDGPVAQGCRIAGLPLPPYTEDASFGSAM